jgi:hypothetical protein
MLMAYAILEFELKRKIVAMMHSAWPGWLARDFFEDHREAAKILLSTVGGVRRCADELNLEPEILASEPEEKSTPNVN